ncbi:L,D-transpeptidase [Roseibium sp.]|uniref:L,D-transpeptidase n=1 Tax=Roseibium sp. TaxID=1936156 RepID=UPI003A975BBC
MIKGVLAAFTLLFALLSGSAYAMQGGQFFDLEKRKWVNYGPSYGGKSPVRRKKVSYEGPYSPGTIVVDTAERRLYHVLPGGKAMKYGIGVGKDGFQWAGTHRITRKAEWPGWTPPPQMRARERAKGRILPSHMPGGPNNPLGARALYIGSTLYRIHGTNQPWTIGSAVSSGCIRLANEDVIHLYKNVTVGSKIVVKR